MFNVNLGTIEGARPLPAPLSPPLGARRRAVPPCRPSASLALERTAKTPAVGIWRKKEREDRGEGKGKRERRRGTGTYSRGVSPLLIDRELECVRPSVETPWGMGSQKDVELSIQKTVTEELL